MTDTQYEALQVWADSAAQALQEFCDDAQEAASNPDGEDQLLDIRELLNDHCAIMQESKNLNDVEDGCYGPHGYIKRR